MLRRFASRLTLAAAACAALAAVPNAPVMVAPASAEAQNKTVLPNAFQGFTRNRKDPVKIEANSLEVRDKDKTAVFSGNVIVVQGDTTMRCRELIVHYEGGMLAADPKAPKKQQNTSAQRIRKLEANGGVIVTATDQRATGDRGVFEMQRNIVTLSGNVVVTQGPNVMQGDTLVVDLTSGRSRLDAAKKGGSQRVQGLFVPNSMDKKNKKNEADQPDQPVRKRRPATN
jgi:lipopolysaccharide export system protein LptA